MHYRVCYHNKPHSLRLSNIHIVPMGRGMWHVICELNLRGYEINSWGGVYSGEGWEKSRRSVAFGDEGGIRAELILYPDISSEADIAMEVGNIFKHTYYSVLISRKVYGKRWDEYCNRMIQRKTL